MSISRQNLSIVIVTLKSEKVIHQCIKSLNQNIPIIVVEHSDNKKLKEDLEKKYNNLKCILAKSNLGMGSGNNIGLKAANTDYVLLLNPDVLLEDNTIEELFLASQNLANFSMLAPLEKNFNNYGFLNKKKSNKNLEDAPFEVDFIDGFAMLINKKKFKEIDYFDENFFMYLENNDLCKRSRDKGDLIYIVPKSKINHLAAKAVDKKYEDEVEFSRNWHWIWSKFYFNKKHYGFFKAFYEGFPRYCSSLIKFLFYLLINNKNKKKIYFNRASGFYNAFLGKASWYRPNLDN
jgi:GT2 family glycosyltransferase|tara:strand:- start:541 stop:1413 length:873 start_codon:yes stop_codon:yes gene_type:complete